MITHSFINGILPQLRFKKKSLLAGMALSLVSCFNHATVVEIRTSVGNVQVNLFDTATPKTVENFLNYVKSGAYANNVVHRVEPNFVVQAGGFKFNNDFPPDAIGTGAAVINEPELSNLRGTIAMAKLGSNVNSATSQWFFNMGDNSANLDVQNGGFTVFGQVLGDGMQVVEAMTKIKLFNAGGAFNSIPLRNYSENDGKNNVEPTGNNLVLISDVVVIDPTPATHPELVPVKNTLIKNSGGGGSSSGGGALAWLSLLAVVLFGWRNRSISK